MATYNKPHLSVAEQVKLLRGRGMAIPSTEEAEQQLSVVGYYRLSGYWYPYRRLIAGDPPTRSDEFIDSTTFDQVVNLYDFDRRLKLLAIDALERIEVAMRFRVGYTLGRRGAFAHLDPSNFEGRFTEQKGHTPSRYDECLAKLDAAQARSSEDFVTHFRERYEDRLPIWVATELMDFGGLSVLFEGMKRTDRDEIAQALGVVDAQHNGNGATLANWMQVLNYLRNVCAHHSRLWNRNMVGRLSPRRCRPIPVLQHLASGDSRQISRPFGALCVVAFLIESISPGSNWTTDVARLITEALPASNRSPSEMGFPAEWAALPLWRPFSGQR